MKNSHTGSKSFSINWIGHLQNKIWDRLNTIIEERPERFLSLKIDNFGIPAEFREQKYVVPDEGSGENLKRLGLTPEQVMNEIKEDTIKFHHRNGTYDSYIVESLFHRISTDWFCLNFTEYGWHMNGWNDFSIIGPQSNIWKGMQKQEKFRWEAGPKVIKNPCVNFTEDIVSVEFFVHTDIEGERVIFEQDIYLPGSYEFESKQTVVAHGGNFAIH